jgi:hypothetical protein
MAASTSAPAAAGADGSVPPFKLSTLIREKHGSESFCVAFNRTHPAYADLFATVGANGATVYRLLPGGALCVEQSYVDPDPLEDFYVCRWARLPGGAPGLLLGGKRGVVRVIDTARRELVHSFVGAAPPRARARARHCFTPPTTPPGGSLAAAADCCCCAHGAPPLPPLMRRRRRRPLLPPTALRPQATATA